MKYESHKTTLNERVKNRNESLMIMHAIDAKKNQDKKAKRRAKIQSKKQIKSI
jgi:hypothetical protein